jgi:hypothetical protein
VRALVRDLRLIKVLSRAARRSINGGYVNRRLAIGIGTAVAVLAAGAGVVVLTRPSEPAELAPAAAEPITTIAPDPAAETPSVQARIDRIDLTAAGSPGGGLDLSQRATKPFSMLSVNWTDPAARPSGTLQVRTRSAKTGKWTGWQDLEIAEERADLPVEAARRVGATEPIWAGRSNGVAARLAGTAGLPAGLRLNLIDPDATPAGRGGGEPADPDATPGGRGGGELADPDATPGGQGGGEPVPSASSGDPAPSGSVPPPSSDVPSAPAESAPGSPPVSTTGGPSAPTSTVPVPPATGPVKAQLPPYVSRAAWKANEKLVTDPISVVPQAKMIWVHHTGFRPDYTCAEAPSIIRGIQANDVNDGLSDMGYNFLVDKCGTLYEGRKGGVDKAVVGAHSVGFNTGSVGIALLGDYTSVQPSEAALTTIAQVAAARLGAYGFSPTSTAQMVEGSDGRKWPKGSTVVFPRIAGHKDGQMTSAGYLTVCPGDKMYALLPAIRARSVQMITGLAAKSLAGGASVSGTFYVRSAVTINWTVDTPSDSIARFELLRDGKLAAAPAGIARSGSIPLTPGAHTVAVRAVHTSGGTAVTAAYRVIADVTAPTLSGPAPALRTGTYSPTSIPVTAHFRAADNAKLWQVAATSPARVPLSATSTYWQTSMRPGANTALTVTARDVPGNARTATVTRRAAILPETAAKRTGTWSAKSGSAYLSGRALSSAKKGTKLTYTFTGRSAALLFSRGTATGKADVYLDGKKVATIDTRAAKTTYRQAVWVRSLSAAKHTVTVVVAGTSGRPTVVSDGLAYIG